MAHDSYMIVCTCIYMFYKNFTAMENAFLCILNEIRYSCIIIFLPLPARYQSFPRDMSNFTNLGFASN